MPKLQIVTQTLKVSFMADLYSCRMGDGMGSNAETLRLFGLKNMVTIIG